MSPIEFPTIEIPGHGTFTVKPGLRVTWRIEKKFGLDTAALTRKLAAFFPRKGPDGEDIPGDLSVVFICDVVSACIWDQKQIEPEDIAAAFDDWLDLIPLAKAVLEAFSKTKWLVKTKLREPATIQEQTALPN